VPYEEVPAYLALADFFVTASVTEVHPLSVIEALAAGLPVLGIHSPGISDTVRDTVDGFLTTHDLASFTAVMVRLLLQPELRAPMAANARERSRNYDIRISVSTLLDHYRRLVAEIQARPPTEKLWEALLQEVRQVLGE
jgi:glycosyltransferase involved in cell wall biosynthesis